MVKEGSQQLTARNLENMVVDQLVEHNKEAINQQKKKIQQRDNNPRLSGRAGVEVINRWDMTAMEQSFNESAMACGCEEKLWRHPKNVEYVFQQNNFDGITIVTDKLLLHAPQVESKYRVALIQESRALLPNIYDQFDIVKDCFDLVLTHDPKLLERRGKYLWVPADGVIIHTEGCKIHPKSKLVSMVFSDKSWMMGHRLRHIIAKGMIPKLQLPYEVDLFGSGAGNYIRDKFDGMKDYMFQIATENDQTNHYFTEKILDCFITGTVPIYWGAHNIGEYFDTRGILVFNHPDELTKILKSLTPDLYNEMLPYIKINYEKTKEYMFLDDLFYETIKKGLQNKNNRRIL